MSKCAFLTVFLKIAFFLFGVNGIGDGLRTPSSVSYIKFNFTLTNDLSYNVNLFWITSFGNLIIYTQISPGTSFSQQSYIGHRWLIAGTDGFEVEFECGQGKFMTSGLPVELSKIKNTIPKHPLGLEWSYFDALSNLNPTNTKTYLRDVDCKRTPNIIYLDEKNVGFGGFYQMDFVDIDLANNFQENLRILRCKCPELKIAFDPQFRFTKELSDIIERKQVPMKTIIQSLLHFVSKYELNGFVVHFGDFAPAKTKNELFYKKLSDAFVSYNLVVLGHFSPSKDLYKFVDPSLFKYLDYIQLQLTNWGQLEPVLLLSQSSVYPDSNAFNESSVNGEQDMSSLVQRFIEMGAPREKLIIEISMFGFAYKMSRNSVNTDIGGVAEGLGRYPYDDSFILLSGREVYPQIYDYKTMCRIIDDPVWTKKFDDVQKAAYAFNQDFWVSYNSFESIKQKVVLAKRMGIAGVWLDAVNYDDIYGSCGVTYPVTDFVKSIL